MDDATQTSSASPLASLAGMLICPKCSGEITLGPDTVVCEDCGRRYPIRDGTPLLARMGTTETWKEGDKTAQDSSAYQERYHDVNEATEYNVMYKGSFSKRWTTSREHRLLRRLLESLGHSRMILELPCGGGRLSSQIAPHADLLVEADIAEGQVLYGKRTSKIGTPQAWMTASAFHIPFKNESVDGTVCVRLCHHLPTQEERHRLMKELFRVSKRFVIMTFFDYHSLKNTLRRMRRPLDGKPPKMTMTVAEVRNIAAENGARLVECPMLEPMMSGHRYALMIKDRA